MTKIVSIHSFRGGTGKSNTTANVASQVAMAGHRVGVVDTDIQSPGIHVPFGLNEAALNQIPTLNQFLHGQAKITDVAYHIGEHPGDAPGRKKLAGKSLWLLPSSMDGAEISRILRDGYDVNKLNEGIQTFHKEMKLDYVFIDTHPGLNEETLLSIIVSDILLLILRPDQQDFQGTAVTVDIARSLGVPNLYLVINKVLTRYDFEHLRQQVEQIYSAPVAGIMPLTEDMVDLQSADIFSLRYPDHPWSKAIMGIAQMVMGAK